MEKNTSGPAFPSGQDFKMGDYITSGHSGMTLRDYCIIHGPWDAIAIRKTFKEVDQVSGEEINQWVLSLNIDYANQFLKEKNK